MEHALGSSGFLISLRLKTGKSPQPQLLECQYWGLDVRNPAQKEQDCPTWERYSIRRGFSRGKLIDKVKVVKVMKTMPEFSSLFLCSGKN